MFEKVHRGSIRVWGAAPTFGKFGVRNYILESLLSKHSSFLEKLSWFYKYAMILDI
jgi:hypothetical protein